MSNIVGWFPGWDIVDLSRIQVKPMTYNIYTYCYLVYYMYIYDRI